MKHLKSFLTILIFAVALVVSVPEAGARKMVFKKCVSCGKQYVQTDTIDDNSLCKACAAKQAQETESQEIVYSEELLRKAQNGDAMAQFYLGVCYDFGKGVKQDYKMAVYWYRKSAEQGNVDAQFNLGGCYDTGQGVPQSYEKAAYWYRKAADQGDAAAQYNLGVCYYQGEGVPQSYEKAVQWFGEAAEQSHADAQYYLGMCYEKGEGVDPDPETALEWYRKVAEQGQENAKKALTRLEDR